MFKETKRVLRSFILFHCCLKIQIVIFKTEREREREGERERERERERESDCSNQIKIE